MEKATSKKFLAEVRNKSSKSRILRCIQQLGVATIKEISTICEQSIPNVMHYIDLLISEGIVIEAAVTSSSVGRTPKAYRINPYYGCIVGVELGLLDSARIGFFKLDGSILHSNTVFYDRDKEPEQFIANIINSIRADSIELLGSIEKILQIVIGNPGVVSSHDGSMVLSSEFATWKYLPLKNLFEEDLGIHTKVLNDINLSTIGEKEFGAGKGIDNFIFVRLGMGLKAGIIAKNHLYQGENHAAGEIGGSLIHVVDSSGVHKIVSAEPYLTIPALCKRIASMLPDHKDDAFYKLVSGDPAAVNIHTIAKILGKPSYVNSCVRESGELFGYVLTNVVSVLDISLIIIGGEIIELGDYFFKPVREILHSECTFAPKVIFSSLGENVALLGAFSVGLNILIGDA